MNFGRNLFVLLSIAGIAAVAAAEPDDPPAPEIVSIQNIEFEVSNRPAGWISTGSDQSPQYLKSVSIKYKFKEGVVGNSNVTEDALRDAVKHSAEERCRLLGAADRPEGLPSTATLRMTADISSQQVAIANQQFNGKYTCAVTLKH